MVCLGDQSPHQCQGATSDVCSPQDVCQRQGRYTHSSENRQHHSSQSKRRNSLQDLNGYHFTDVGLVPGEEDLYLSQTSTGPVEHGSRPRVEGETRQFGMETQPSSVQGTDVETGPVSTRSICLEAHDAASTILQLEARSKLSGDKCPGLELVKSKSLRFPSLCPD